MIKFCPLASGSKGNSLFLSTPETKILIDFGLSPKLINARLEELGSSLAEIDAIFISHEHSDHIQGLNSLKEDIPIIANSETARAIRHELDNDLRFKIFTTDEPFTFQDLFVTPFSIPHDTVDPVAFTFENSGMKIGVCADLGFPTTFVEHHLKGCHLLYLESNHDPDMVHASSRPSLYKLRVLSRSGHLSNQEASDLVSRLQHPGLLRLYLAHLSQECNSPEKALSTLQKKLTQTSFDVQIAWQDKRSEVFHA